jgi:hypothetical protein
MLVLSSGSIQLARKSANNVQRSKRVSVEASHRNTSRGEEVQKRNSACVSTIMSGLSIACLPSEASDGLSSLSSQILEISDAATPFLYVGFLASSLAFTIGTVSRIFFSSSFNLRFMNHSTLH